MLGLCRNLGKRVTNLPKIHIGRYFCDGMDTELSASDKEVPVITGERSLNKLTLIGRLGRAPEVRGTEERPVTIFSVATSVTLRAQDGGYRQITDWHRVSVFRNKLQEWTAVKLNKGDRVYVTGAVRYGKYVDKATNELIRSVTVIADDVFLLSKPSRGWENDGNNDGFQP